MPTLTTSERIVAWGLLTLICATIFDYATRRPCRSCGVTLDVLKSIKANVCPLCERVASIL